ncbi:SCO7613 C-terminal domain-containing membrane protein [Plantactinospora sp. GCM10030261]|uniref:SCO7613 C-terminal domain-containing membrane protein n=1 Tax=Plantactinospora sp. GCM10030261 TaxID=3273420 RepID=UPI003623C7AA
MTTYPCPACGAPADLTAGCSGCRRPGDPVAAEVIRLDGLIATGAADLERARQRYAGLADELRELRARRNHLAARVRAGTPVQASPGPLPAGPLPAGPLPAGPLPAGPLPAGPAGPPETTTRTVQNVLFVLGGLLLGAAAVVFTAVAWASVGVTGRAAILVAVTALVLAVPVPLWRRGLTGTAETFAAVGVLLVVLDGYAARTVNLVGLADWPTARYAAVVAAGTALLAAGYGRLTGLRAPWFAALALAQPVLPLTVVELDPSAAGWTLVLAATACLDLVTARRLSGGGPARAGRLAGWIGYGCAVTAAGVCALVALLTTEPAALAGGPLLVVALVLLAGAAVAGQPGLRAAATATLVAAVAIAAVRPAPDTRWPLLWSGIVVALVAIAVTVAGPRLSFGGRIGALVVAGLFGVTIGSLALLVAGVVAARSPLGEAAPAVPEFLDGQLPMGVVLVTVALAALLPRARGEVAVVGGVFGVLALPATAPLPVLAIVAVDLVAALALLLTATRLAGAAGLAARAVGAAGPVRAAGSAWAVLAVAGGVLLIGHAVLVGLIEAGSATVAFVGVALLGLIVAVRVGRLDAAAPVGLRLIGGSAITAALLSGQAALTAATVAGTAGGPWPGRVALGAVAATAAGIGALRRRLGGHLPYAVGALVLGALAAGIAPILTGGGDPVGGYAAAGLLLVAIGLALGAGPGVRVSSLVTGAALGCVVVVALVRPMIALLAGPYAWLGEIWSGAPVGVGLGPGDSDPAWTVDGADAAVLALLTAAAAVFGSTRRGSAGPVMPLAAARLAAPLAAVTLAALPVAAGLRWPVPAATALVIGVTALLLAALAPVATARALVPLVPVSGVLAGAGLTGLLPTRSGTLSGMGLLVVAGVAAGAAGRSRTGRITGWLTATTTGALLAVVATVAAAQPVTRAALPVLGVAAVALLGGAVLRSRRPAGAAVVDRDREAVAIEAAAHATAVVAIMLSVGQLRVTALICTLWGVAVGLRALRPGEPRNRRVALVAVATGSQLLALWLLLAANRVALAEAYTVPVALAALAAGGYAARLRRELSSWVTHAPGLAAAFLPTLASVLVGDGGPVRRLTLGAGAVAVLLTGAVHRLQAPVVLGGVTLALVAVHEAAGVWDLLPRWIYLAGGGLLLVTVAATYERRRRELDRLRGAVRQMT